jgi:hypothetical protein
MKRVLLILSILSVAISAFGVGVDVTELKNASQKIEFVNYTGPLTIFQTDFDIRGIGRSLAALVEKGNMPALYLTKYTAIHAMSATEPEKYGADIISIDKDSAVDHIDNVRRIVSSYLGRLYSYPRKDCDVLALFVSYYNATYRGNLSYFGSKYKTVVTKNLVAERVGISTKYYEWPGATQLVIPLSDKPVSDILGALSTSELTSKEVVDQLKAREDKGVQERQAMVDLKEREVAQGQKTVEQQAKELADQKAKIAAQEAALQKEKLAADRKKAEADAAAAALKAEQEKAKAIADEQARAKREQELAAQEQAVEKKAAEAAAAQEAAKAKEEQIAGQKAEQQKQQEAIASEQSVLESKKAEIATEKKEIQSDQTAQRIQQQPEQVQKELEQKSAELAQRETAVTQREEAAKKGETDASIYAGWLYYLKIKEYLTGGHYNNEIYAINAASAKIEVKSPVVNICGRKYDIFKDGVVVITHKGNHSAGHYLTLLDLKTLQPKATGTDAVFFRSFVEVRDNYVYAILNREDAYYLGMFDTSMKAVAVSKDKVDADSFISFFGDLIYINSQDKKILVLKKADLSTSGVIEP